MSKILALVVAFAAQSALACPSSTLKIHDLTLNSDGLLTRTVTVKQESDSQNGKASANPKYASVVRDRIQLERDDEITMNAGLQMVDASVVVKVKVKDQHRDEQGIISTTYKILQTNVGSFAGIEQVSQKAYLAKVMSSYLGGGMHARGCGEVVITALEITEEAN